MDPEDKAEGGGADPAGAGGTPPKKGDGGTPPKEGGGAEPKAPKSFDELYDSLPEGTRGLVDQHISGLRSALTSERDERKKLAKELRDLGSRLKDGESSTKKELEDLSGKLENYNQQVTAYESLSAAGAKNLKLAYLAAREEGLVLSDGTVKVEQLRDRMPELFAQAAPAKPKAGAGSGTGETPPAGEPKKLSMNDIIRKRAI